MVETYNKQKLANAQKKFKEGKDALKTGLFKWSKNYAEAAIRFEQAAKLFKELGDHKSAIEAYLEFA
jgi:hypothetical protein